MLLFKVFQHNEDIHKILAIKNYLADNPSCFEYICNLLLPKLLPSPLPTKRVDEDKEVPRLLSKARDNITDGCGPPFYHIRVIMTECHLLHPHDPLPLLLLDIVHGQAVWHAPKKPNQRLRHIVNYFAASLEHVHAQLVDFQGF